MRINADTPASDLPQLPADPVLIQRFWMPLPSMMQAIASGPPVLYHGVEFKCKDHSPQGAWAGRGSFERLGPPRLNWKIAYDGERRSRRTVACF
jgi:hypothetical protein